MSLRQHSIEVSLRAREVKGARDKKLSPPYRKRWQTVLDDPSFRRLLRDGHQADTTALLLAQLEDDE